MDDKYKVLSAFMMDNSVGKVRVDWLHQLEGYAIFDHDPLLFSLQYPRQRISTMDTLRIQIKRQVISESSAVECIDQRVQHMLMHAAISMGSEHKWEFRKPTKQSMTGQSLVNLWR